MDIIKNYNDKKWTLQYLDALYNSIDSSHIYLATDCKVIVINLFTPLIRNSTFARLFFILISYILVRQRH
jgi:hypothetical protein